jgi:hypothetical protein
LESSELGFLSVLAQTSLMAAGAGESQSQGVERILSYADELMGVLRASTDRDGIAEVSGGHTCAKWRRPCGDVVETWIPSIRAYRQARL